MRYMANDCVGCERCVRCSRFEDYEVIRCDKCKSEILCENSVYEYDGMELCRWCYEEELEE